MNALSKLKVGVLILAIVSAGIPNSLGDRIFEPHVDPFVTLGGNLDVLGSKLADYNKDTGNQSPRNLTILRLAAMAVAQSEQELILSDLSKKFNTSQRSIVEPIVTRLKKLSEQDHQFGKSYDFGSADVTAIQAYYLAFRAVPVSDNLLNEYIRVSIEP